MTTLTQATSRRHQMARLDADLTEWHTAGFLSGPRASDICRRARKFGVDLEIRARELGLVR